MTGMSLPSDPTTTEAPVIRFAALPRTQGEGDEQTQGHHHSSLPSPSLAAPRVGYCAAEEAEDDCAAADEAEDDGDDDAAGGEAEWGAPASPSSPRRRPRGGNTTRRDPRRAELFRRLDAASFAARRREATLRPPSPPTTTTEDEDPNVPIWPPQTAAWRLFRDLRAMESSPANPVFNPDENSFSHSPPKKSWKMLSDKNTGQCDDTQHSSESASYQIVLYENGHGENHIPVPSKKRGLTIGAYTVQCSKCLKWRLIPTKKKYEEIRERIRQVPFLCEQADEWKPGVTCNDPTDASQDDGRIWAIDKPSIAQAPLGWERLIKIRSEGGSRFADVYYISPTGKTLRSMADVAKYLEDNRQYAAGIQLSQFSFKIPAPLQRDYVKKRLPQSKPLQPEEVLPLSCAPPIHEDLAHNMLFPYKEGNPVSDLPQDQLLGDVQT